jgi:hypothetical protein
MRSIKNPSIFQLLIFINSVGRGRGTKGNDELLKGGVIFMEVGGVRIIG